MPAFDFGFVIPVCEVREGRHWSIGVLAFPNNDGSDDAFVNFSSLAR